MNGFGCARSLSLSLLSKESGCCCFLRLTESLDALDSQARRQDRQGGQRSIACPRTCAHVLLLLIDVDRAHAIAVGLHALVSFATDVLATDLERAWLARAID